MMPKPPSPFFFHVSLFTMMEICERVRVCVCPCISLSTLYNKQCLLLARFCAFLPSFFTFCCCYSCCWCVWVHQHNGNIQSESINEAVQCSHLTICFLYTFAHTHTHEILSTFFSFLFFCSCCCCRCLYFNMRKFNRTRNSRNICYFSHFDDL